MSGKYDIVLIDSGIERSHKAFCDFNTEGASLTYDLEGKVVIAEDYNDNIGHGTAISYLLKNTVPDVELFVLKVFENGEDVQTEKIIDALEYVYNNIDCKIIHLSCGCTYCYSIKELHDICIKIRKKGTIIVAAYDNDGCLSYPAVFDEVIGVDWSLSCRHISDFQYVEGSPINVRAIGGEQRVAWINNCYRLVSGSSFAAPHVSAFVLKEIRKGNFEFLGIMNSLKAHAKKVFKEKTFEESNSFKINKAIIFPFNKEEHSLVLFSDLLKFDISDIYDIRMSGKVNKTVKEVLQFSGDQCAEYTIKDCDYIDWNGDFDTIIVGHLREISNLIKKDLLEEILDKCIKYKKSIYSFDSLEHYQEECNRIREEGCNFYYPKIKKEYIPTNRFCKLNCIGRPTVLIMGTSSKQGKFTVQLLLRRKLQKLGYKVGQLGTEPSALLYGMDEVYPVGYDSTVEIEGYNSIHMINYLLSKIEKQEPDIILVGSQSHSLHLNNGNLNFYPIYNYELLMATNPDAVVVCVNYNDDIEYIKKTINFIEVFQDTKVIALVVYPVDKKREWRIFTNELSTPPEEELNQYKNLLIKNINLPVNILGKEEEIDRLVENVLEFF